MKKLILILFVTSLVMLLIGIWQDEEIDYIFANRVFVDSLPGVAQTSVEPVTLQEILENLYNHKNKEIIGVTIKTTKPVGVCGENPKCKRNNYVEIPVKDFLQFLANQYNYQPEETDTKPARLIKK